MQASLFLLPFLVFTSKVCFASGGNSSLNFYSSFAELFGLQVVNTSILAALTVLFVTFFIGLYFKQRAKKILSDPSAAPEGRVSFFGVMETVAEFVCNLCEEQCGKYASRALFLVGGVFFFILLSNLSGLIPGFPPPTESFTANLAMGFASFLFYNYAGLCEHGSSYAKQFMGPLVVLAPMFIVLELISHCARPISLAFRLTVNIFADHLLLGVFSHIVPLFVPVVFLMFGLLVAFIQSFVFTLLSGVYVNMAVSHDH